MRRQGLFFSTLIILVLLTLVMGYIVFTRVYTLFMHPRFRVLTAIAVLMLFASTCAVVKTRSVRIGIGSNIVLYSSIFCIIVAIVHFSSSEPEGRGVIFSQKEGSAEIADKDSDEDIWPVSIPDLYISTLESDSIFLSQPFILRGIVLRHPIMDFHNSIALGRVFLTCCYADSVRLIFSVALPENTSPEDFPDGSWVQVQGILRSAEPASWIASLPIEEFSKIPRIPSDILNPEYLISAESLKPDTMPNPFYVSNLRAHRPYNY